MIFRIHHPLGDGISLMSLLLSGCRKVGDPTAVPEIPPARSKKGERRGISLWERAVGVLGMVWFSLIFVVEFVMRLAWVRDRKTAISGGDGVELWPRKLTWLRSR